MPRLSDYVRLDWKTKTAKPLTLADVERESRPHAAAAAETWRELATAGAREILDEYARHPHHSGDPVAAIATLEAQTAQTLARNGVVRLAMPIADAVRSMADDRDPHVHAPKTAKEPWIVRTAPSSTYRGELFALFAGPDGATYARRIESEHAPTLEAIAQKENLQGIPVLLAKRAEQRAAAFAPETRDEAEEIALARTRLRKKIMTDEETNRGRGLLDGSVFVPPKPKLGDEARDQVLADVRNRVEAEHAERTAQTPGASQAGQQ